jgi:uncharacterized membrane protein
MAMIPSIINELSKLPPLMIPEHKPLTHFLISVLALLVLYIIPYNHNIVAGFDTQVLSPDELLPTLKYGTTELKTYQGEEVIEGQLTTRQGSTDFARGEIDAYPPGKYRAIFRLSIDQPAQGTTNNAVLRVEQNGVDTSKRVHVSIPLHWADFPADGSPIDIPVDFTVEEGSDSGYPPKPLLFITSWSQHGDLMVIRNHGITIENLNPSLGITNLKTDKLIYRRDEPCTAQLTIENFATRPKKGTLKLFLTRELADEQLINEQNVSLSAGETKELAVHFPTSTNEYGHSIRADLTDDSSETDTVETPFNVADDWWKVAIGSDVSAFNLGKGTVEKITGDLTHIRDNYANWFEMFFWASDDWGDLTPNESQWYSGQGNYFQQLQSVHNVVDIAHQLGLKAVTYGKSTAGGPVGWELARQHPDWFQQDRQGRTIGVYDQYKLENWNNRELRESGGLPTTWLWLQPDLRNEEALNWGIREIIQSTQQFGWDGVRFDGHFTAGNDELSTYNIQETKKQIWNQLPNFVFGYNYGYHPDATIHDDSTSHAVRETMAGGGYWLAEAVRTWKYTPSILYENWQDYLTREQAAVKKVAALGGNYSINYNLGNAARQDLYKWIYGLVAGDRSFNGAHEHVGGSPAWGKFLTRWSGFLWDSRLQSIAKPENLLTVESDQLLWKSLVQERVISPNRRFIIVHLINPPPSDDITDTNLPSPVTEVPVTLTHGGSEQLVRTTLVRPDQEPFDVALAAATTTPTIARVTVPTVKNWAMVVFELTGDYSYVEPTADRFTEPADQQQVKAGRSDESNADPNVEIWETDQAFSGIPAEVAADHDATGGLAQVKDKDMPTHSSHFMGHTWLGPLAPGRYRISYRLKWTDTEPYHAWRTYFYVTDINGGYDPVKQWYLTPDCLENLETCPVLPDNITKAQVNSTYKALEPAGDYHYYSFDVELKQGGYINTNLITYTEDAGDQKMYLGHVKTELLERYPDTTLESWFSVEKPAGLPAPAGADPKNILFVDGLYGNLYQVDSLPGVEKTYTLPETYGDLYRYDAIVLADVDFTESTYQLRKILKDYVEDGGRLVVLGGPVTLGQGGMKDTYLEDILPMQISSFNEVVEAPTSTVLQPALTGAPFADKPALFWLHDTTLKDGATAIAYANKQPVAARWKMDDGLVSVFTGTVLGSQHSAAMPPFWETNSWKDILGQLVLGL